MTDATAAAPPPATGIKAKVGEVVMKGYLAAPPPAQTAMLNGYLKAQPAIAKAKPYAKPAALVAVPLLVLRKVRSRKG